MVTVQDYNIFHTELQWLKQQINQSFKLTADTPYLTLMSNLWGVCCKDVEEIAYVIMAPHCIVLDFFLPLFHLENGSVILLQFRNSFGTVDCSNTCSHSSSHSFSAPVIFWLLGNLNDILCTWFFRYFQWLMAEVSLVKLPLDECHSTLLIISQHWFR